MPSLLWAALLPPPPNPPGTEGGDDASQPSQGLAWWCLQFTPRVATLPCAVVMELSASARLFGGTRALAARIRAESELLGVQALAWAPSSLAAMALARCGQRNGFAQPLAQLLDALPLSALDATQAHAPTLARLGCATLGQVRALPRSGVMRRFGKVLLAALDQAYGLQPEAHDWIALPAQFHARLELPHRADTTAHILHGAGLLLRQMCGWLAAHRAGVTQFTLRWRHDALRSSAAAAGGELGIRTAASTRQIDHLQRLLQEHLAHVVLEAPVIELELLAPEPQPLAESAADLLPDPARRHENLPQVLERIAARLGAGQVLRPMLCDDHRPEWQACWQPAGEPLPAAEAPLPTSAQPSFLLEQPLPLAQDKQGLPVYQGPLQLVVGPQRLEGGWWHRSPDFALPGEPAQQTAHNAVRDYWIAASAHAGLLWIYQTRLEGEQGAWFLHGIFA
ncbi:MAG: Y-family DNA polymerase [Comamonas sp.]